MLGIPLIFLLFILKAMPALAADPCDTVLLSRSFEVQKDRAAASFASNQVEAAFRKSLQVGEIIKSISVTELGAPEDGQRILSKFGIDLKTNQREFQVDVVVEKDRMAGTYSLANVEDPGTSGTAVSRPGVGSASTSAVENVHAPLVDSNIPNETVQLVVALFTSIEESKNALLHQSPQARAQFVRVKRQQISQFAFIRNILTAYVGALTDIKNSKHLAQKERRGLTTLEIKPPSVSGKLPVPVSLTVSEQDLDVIMGSGLNSARMFETYIHRALEKTSATSNKVETLLKAAGQMLLEIENGTLWK